MFVSGAFGVKWGSIEATLPSGTTHNWNPALSTTGAVVIYVTSDPAGSTIGGIVNAIPDRIVIIRPIGGGALQVLHEDASATAANRIILIQSATVNLSNYLPLVLIYDFTSQRWRQVGNGI
jgi:hypothetical protein